MTTASTNANGTDWQPVELAERFSSLDLIRGLALFGVLIINLLYFFRLSLFDHIFQFHSHSGLVNHSIDLALAELVEFKAINLFSLTFGVGVAVQAERAGLRGVRAELFLIRRFSILLLAGACHMVLVANVDILMLYAVCGLILVLFLRLPTALLAVAGIAAIYLPNLIHGWPSEAELHAGAANAALIYPTGTYLAILEFRWHETLHLILPILKSVAQHFFGLMLLGVAIWRCGVIQQPSRFRKLLWAIALIAGLTGLLNTSVEVLAHENGSSLPVPLWFKYLGSNVPLALAYGAALLAWRRSQTAMAITSPLVAAGRMALTNYLTQSIVLSILFYGYGFRLFGRLDPQSAAAIGVIFYAVQLWFSAWWLRRFRFGPFEWVWRSLTYGRWVAIRNRIG